MTPPFALSEIKADPVGTLSATMATAPLLVSDGWWHPGLLSRINRDKARAELLESWYVEQYVRAAEWLSAVPPSRTMNRKSTSYSWKHVAQRWHERREGEGRGYVSNGAFLAGCLAMGRRIEPIPGSLNTFCAIPAGARKARLPAMTDKAQLAWLCEMAAIGCLHENRSAWAAQLRQDAAKLRQAAEREGVGR